MKKHNKTTPFLMILVLSMVATQLSLQAVGINITPSIGTMVHSWGKMASLIGGVYQPGFAAELDTLSNHLLCNEGKTPAETEKPCGDLACNKMKDFEFELPPTIDPNDQTVTIEEPVQEFVPRTLIKLDAIPEEKSLDMLSVEVLEIASDADEGGAPVGGPAEKREEAVRSIAIGIATEEPEAESKAAPTFFGDKVFFTTEEEPVAPKADKAKKPCSELEKTKKFEEIKKLQEEFQLEPEWYFTEQPTPSFAMQAYQASQNMERPRRVRVIIKRNFTPLPLALPRSLAKESINFVDVGE